jgi:O-antigen ligase
MSSIVKHSSSGALFPRRSEGESETQEIRVAKLLRQEKVTQAVASPARFKAAFAGLFVFTFLLYARPQEMFSEFFGSFPLVKLVAGATLLAYCVAKLTASERFTIWPLELTMLAIVVFLGLAFTPIAASPQDSLTVLMDTYLKVVLIFVLMINLLDSQERLQALIKLSVVCGSVLAVFAISSYVNGNFLIQSKQSIGRVAGIVQGMFGNPNDLALSLNLLLPFAVILALSSRGMKRALYFICAALLTVGVIVTFSRGGFLGLIAAGGVLLWKLSKRNRALAILALLVASVFFLVVMPAGYSNRLTTIFSIEDDPTGSAQARRELLNRGVQVASNHLVIGVGMGNFHIYSIREQVAHNAYLEIAAELGVTGLIAYLILIFAPLRSLRRIERETRKPRGGALIKGRDAPQQETYYYSVALQAALIAYLINSFFGSVEYQWHVYYLAAYTIALRQIYAKQQAGFVSEVAAEPTRQRQRPAGVLWQARQRAEGNRLQERQNRWSKTEQFQEAGE